MTMPGKELRCDRMNYRKEDQRVEGRGNLSIIDLKEHATITGGWGEYYRETQISKIFGRPVLTHVDSAKQDTVTITGDSMVYVEAENKSTAYDNVVITSGDLRATGGRGEYFEKTNLAFLSVGPFCYFNNSYMTGESIRLEIEGRALNRVIVRTNAQGKYLESDSTSDSARISEVFGDTIRMFLEDDEIKRIFVSHNARSYYYQPDQRSLADEAAGKYIRMELDKKTVQEVVVNGNASSIYYNREKNKTTGRNDASGDTIKVNFANDKVSSVLVYGSAKGIYTMKDKPE
jgi:lipopolysaccharide export system protein LptA